MGGDRECEGAVCVCMCVIANGVTDVCMRRIANAVTTMYACMYARMYARDGKCGNYDVCMYVCVVIESVRAAW